MAERPECWEEKLDIVPPNLQAPRKPRGAKKKEKKQAEKEALDEAKAAREEKEETEIKGKRSKRQRKGEPGGSAQGSGTKVLPGPTLPLDSHPDRVREYLEKWGMVAPSTRSTAERPDESERPKKRMKRTPEEQEDAKKLRSRKCCAYQKARKAAQAEGKTEEEVKRIASEAGEQMSGNEWWGLRSSRAYTNI